MLFGFDMPFCHDSADICDLDEETTFSSSQLSSPASVHGGEGWLPYTPLQFSLSQVLVCYPTLRPCWVSFDHLGFTVLIYVMQ